MPPSPSPDAADIPRPPFTNAVRLALQGIRNAAAEADLLFLEAWEMCPLMHPGSALRASQIRRANPDLAAALTAELKALAGVSKAA
jgi:hypothetical protein